MLTHLEMRKLKPLCHGCSTVWTPTSLSLAALLYLKKKEGGIKCRTPVDKAYSGFCYSPNWRESQNVMQCGLGVFPSKDSPFDPGNRGASDAQPCCGEPQHQREAGKRVSDVSPYVLGTPPCVTCSTALDGFMHPYLPGSGRRIQRKLTYTSSMPGTRDFDDLFKYTFRITVVSGVTSWLSLWWCIVICRDPAVFCWWLLSFQIPSCAIAMVYCSCRGNSRGFHVVLLLFHEVAMCGFCHLLSRSV